MLKAQRVTGILIMLIAVGAFSCMDAGLKVLSPHYAPMQVAALRGISSLPIIFLWTVFAGGLGQLIRVRWKLHALRGVLSIIMLATFSFALRYLPLAEAYSIFFIAPLLITIFAIPILGERVEWQRWMAIVLGFFGVLIVLRPSGSSVFTWGGLAIIVSASCYAVSAVTVRILSRTDSTQSMVFWLIAALSLGASALALPAWSPIHSEHWPILIMIAVTGTIGQYAITEAFRRAHASIIAPFEYTALAWGLGLDWWLWNTLPDHRMMVGAAVIVMSGLYLIYREHPLASKPTS